MAGNNTLVQQHNGKNAQPPCPLLDRYLEESRGRLNSTYVANCFINGPFALVAVTANALVIASIYRQKSLRSQTYYFLTALAVSDFGVGLLVQPFYILYKVAGLLGNSRVNCATGISFIFIANQLAGVSLLTLTLVSVDRFMALYLHLRYNELVTVTKVKIAIFIPWLLTALLNATWFWNLDIYYMISFLGFVLCSFITFLVYVMIFRVVRRHHLQIRREPKFYFSSTKQEIREHHNCTKSETQAEIALHITRSRKSAISMLVVYLLFLSCASPLVCVLVLSWSRGRNTDVEIAFNFSMSLVFINSTLNPFLFCYRMREVRQAVAETLRKITLRTC